MGWWSTDIMGGDKPLDFEDSIFKICKVEKFSDLKEPDESGLTFKLNWLSAEDINNNLGFIIDMIEDTEYEKEIGYQVLSVLMMQSGAKIPESLFPLLEDSCHQDEWAKSDSERQLSITGLFMALRAYDGHTPIEVRSHGLFEVMNEKLNNN